MDPIEAADAAAWRDWLRRNGTTAAEVWLVLHHKDSAMAGIRYAEAVEQALCFGWIDGHHRSLDASSSQLRFTPRGARSSWSAVNRVRAQAMIDQGAMTPAGLAVIEQAKADGRWQVVADDQRDAVEVELLVLLAHDATAADNYDRFPPSSKRLILEWVATAKRPDTRRRRLHHTVALAAEGVRANHPGAPGLNAR